MSRIVTDYETLVISRKIAANKTSEQRFTYSNKLLNCCSNDIMETKEFRPQSDEIPGQQLPYPASQSDMDPAPDSDLSNYKPAGKLTDKVALITGADSGIGRAVAIAFAMEGADVAIVYNENTDDANTTKKMVESKGRSCLVIQADVRIRLPAGMR